MFGDFLFFAVVSIGDLSGCTNKWPNLKIAYKPRPDMCKLSLELCK